MRLRIATVVTSLAMAGALVGGCATGGGGKEYQSFMQTCTANAKTEQERSACAWENASRMAGGGK
jgi:hypothetical protein